MEIPTNTSLLNTIGTDTVLLVFVRDSPVNGPCVYDCRLTNNFAIRRFSPFGAISTGPTLFYRRGIRYAVL